MFGINQLTLETLLRIENHCEGREWSLICPAWELSDMPVEWEQRLMFMAEYLGAVIPGVDVGPIPESDFNVSLDRVGDRFLDAVAWQLCSQIDIMDLRHQKGIQFCSMAWPGLDPGSPDSNGACEGDGLVKFHEWPEPRRASWSQVVDVPKRIGLMGMKCPQPDGKVLLRFLMMMRPSPVYTYDNAAMTAQEVN